MGRYFKTVNILSLSKFQFIHLLVSMELGFPNLFSGLYLDIIYFDAQIVPNLASSLCFKTAPIFLICLHHSLITRASVTLPDPAWNQLFH